MDVVVGKFAQPPHETDAMLCLHAQTTILLLRDSLFVRGVAHAYSPGDKKTNRTIRGILADA